MFNLDKIFYSGEGFTKAQLIDYNLRIASWLLPHYEKRPVTMLRFPDGGTGKAFYEKDARKHTPLWVRGDFICVVSKKERQGFMVRPCQVVGVRGVAAREQPRWTRTVVSVHPLVILNEGPKTRIFEGVE